MISNLATSLCSKMTDKIINNKAWSPADIASCRFLLDATDSSTLFQNVDGTTPVTTLNQSVLSVLDKSSNATLFSGASGPLYGSVPIAGVRNLLWYTREFDNSFWTKTNATILANATQGPDGTTTADRITLSDVAGAVVRKSTWCNWVGKTFTLSCYFKNDTLSAGQTFNMTYSLDNAGVVFNLTAVVDIVNQSATYSLTGTVTTGYSGVATGSVEEVGDGWIRVSVTGTMGSGIGWNQIGIIEIARISGSRQFFATDIQLEIGNSATNPQVVSNGNLVTENGINSTPCLWFGGHGLNANIDLSAVNKLTVVSAVYRPIFTSNMAIINQNAVNNPSSWQLRYGAANAPVVFAATGTTYKEGPQVSFNFGLPSVLIGRVNIGGPFISVQQNNSAISTTSTTLGTGNFANSQVRIGQRTDGLTPMIGHIVAIALFTDILSVDDLNAVRTWMGSKIGLVL